eukprot:1634206-Amphidinium_carterae.1
MALRSSACAQSFAHPMRFGHTSCKWIHACGVGVRWNASQSEPRRNGMLNFQKRVKDLQQSFVQLKGKEAELRQRVANLHEDSDLSDAIARTREKWHGCFERWQKPQQYAVKQHEQES